MSAPDARLSAAERAALADLEEAAMADDPSLAARLRGTPSASRLRAFLPTVQPAIMRSWGLVLRLRWWGAPITLAGLALTVLGLSTNLVVSVCGAVISAVGLRVLAEMVESRAPRPRSAPEG